MTLTLGVDASSTKSGVAIIEDGEVIEVGLHKSNKKLTLSQRLREWGLFLVRFRAKRKIELVAIEEVSSARNMNTVRLLSYFAAVPIYQAGEWNTPVIIMKTATIRKQAVGKGNADKEFVYNIYRKQIKLCDFNNGGNDQSDAIATGIAGEKLHFG